MPTYSEKVQQAIAQLQKTAKNLLQQGMNITQVAQIAGLSENKIEQLMN